MAKKTSAARRGKATPGRTSAARDTSAGTVRSTRAAQPGATSGLDQDGEDPIGAGSAEAPKGAKLSASPGRSRESKLTQLERERETALATGQEQPHPTQAPRAGRTSPDSGPVGRAHQPLTAIDDDEDRVPNGSIKVRARRLGEYANRRRRPGDVFYVTPRLGKPLDPVLETEGPNKGQPKTNRNGRPITKRVKRIMTAEEQLGSWMELVDESTSLKESTSGDMMPRGSKAAKTRASDEDAI